jgi:hypothetical protein
MRAGALLTTLLAAVLVAGCTSDPPAPAGEPAPSGATEASVERQDVSFAGSAVDTPAGGIEGRVAFRVAAGTALLQADAEWSCVSLCPLHLILEAPGGDAAAEAEGGSGLTLEVQGPASGDWSFVWRSRDGASVEPSGTVHLAFESLE